MPLDFVQLEFWTYGFFGAVFTATAGWAYGLTALWWFALVQLAIHREDPEPLRFDFHVWWLISISSGLLTGFSLLWSLRMDRLIDTEFLNYRNAKRYLSIEFLSVIIWTTVAYAGFYYMNGDFSNGFGTVPLTTGEAVGVTMIVVGALALLGTFIWMFANRTDRKESTLNAKYILALALGLLAAPAAYDYPHNKGLGPWHGLIALGAITLYWALMILWIGFTFVNPETGSFKFGNWISKNDTKFIQKSLQGHHIDRFASPKQAMFFLGFGFMSQFVLYLVAWGVDTHFKVMEPTEVVPVVVAIAITSLVLSILFVLLYYFGRDSFWPSASLRKAVSNYDEHTSSKLI